jgi:glycine/D-amino acid oxidase-like deaminating enzyme
MASGWTLGGVRQSGRHPAELPLARAAVEIWGGLNAMLGADVEYRRGGNLRLARTPAEVDVIRGIVAEQTAQGLDLQFLPDTDAVRAVAPAISTNVLALRSARPTAMPIRCWRRRRLRTMRAGWVPRSAKASRQPASVSKMVA